jgi:MSHA biogenesis protein MshJ
MSEYWSILQQQYQQLAARVNQIVLRERILLLIALVALIYTLWALLVMLPQRKTINQLETREATLSKQVTQLQQEITNIEKNMITPSADAKSSDIIGSKTISKEAIVPMLKSLLTKHRDMVLTKLDNLPDRVWNLPASYTDIKLPIKLYEQGVTLVFNSDYLSTYEYLRSLENLKWLIFFDELQYVVTEHPNAEVKLTVYTVGPDKEDK